MLKKITIKPFINKAGKRDPKKRTVACGELSTTLILRHASWQARFTAGGTRHNLNLGRDLDEAAQAVIAKLRLAHAGVEINTTVNSPEPTINSEAPTIGEILRLYIDAENFRDKVKTRRDNANRLRRMIREVRGITKDQSKDGDYVVEPSIDCLSSSILDGKFVTAYQTRCLKGIKEGARREAAKRGSDRQLDNVRGIFSKVRLASNDGEGLYPNLPECVKNFLRVPKLGGTKQPFRYKEVQPFCQSAFDRIDELKESDPSAYLMIKLSAYCGLRPGESAVARMDWISGEKGDRELSIKVTDDWTPKSKQERTVPLPDSLYDEINDLTDDSDHIVPLAGGGWVKPHDHHCGRHGKVIKLGGHFRKVESNGDNERLSGLSKRANRWISEIKVGKVVWPFEKKLHTFRKWFGAQVATQAGIYAAQKMLGHADIKTTEEYYADLVKPPTYTIKIAA